MRIIFNLYNVGLGNNGGSRTIIKCGENLAKFGVEVVLYSNAPNNYTWHTPKGVKIIQNDSPPAGDIVIATGFRSVQNTLITKAKKRFYYIRGLELWQASTIQLVKSYRRLNCIVNSQWLYYFLKSKGIRSSIIYPGLDFHYFRNLHLKRNKSIGALYNSQHATKRYSDAVILSNMLKIKLRTLNKDIREVNDRRLNLWYNTISIWFAPTELEGLHNPPMEASLAGCALVCTNHPRCGMQDYAVPNQTALVYSAGNIREAEKCIRKLFDNRKLREKLNNNMVKLLKTKIGDRKSNMVKLLKIIS